MKLVTYRHNHKTSIGALREDHIVDLSDVAPDMLSLIALGSDGLVKANLILTSTELAIPIKSVTLLAPIPVPRRNVICLGLNYSEHAVESYAATGIEAELPSFPIVFTKATTSINGPFSSIPFNSEVSQQIDWEVELAVIIGRLGKDIPPEKAMNHVFGYTVLNDISARDLQRQHKQFFKGKSLDGACPMGPWIVTADELTKPHDLRLTCRVNDILKQDSNTAHMIFDIPATIDHLSRGMTLLSGDIIATGTPSGVGFARQPPEFLSPGDIVECEIQGIGSIRNLVSSV